ncbi:hypothetical protein AVEN_228567-1 [Araneus ventricosus]|uniref:Histone-lysine N-methyltransferase SETMAR n=1 Tax=Araneus ventricosus TaxID=182803 RepID=A0A4Y2FNL6_ARAVE|nr:hypothetical protein AVEN_228567-1 [Araneus ventricosus]
MLIKIRDVIREKRRNEFRSKVVFFHQDTARPHVRTMTDWTLYNLEWDLMQHPPYSPDMAPLDFYLFCHLQLHLDRAIFNSNEEIINEAISFWTRARHSSSQKGLKSCQNVGRRL